MSEENIRVINLKKKKFNPESLIHFLVLASGQLVAFSYFRVGTVSVQHISGCKNLH